MKLYPLILTILLIFYSGVSLAQRLTITANIANIRSGPGKKYDILWQVELYHPIMVLNKTGQWYHFQDFEGDEGWIHQSLLGKIQSIITKSERCNVRSGPGTDYKILFTVEKGIPFKALERKGKWIYIRHADGDKGWIHQSLVW
jgi:SH3-like domain-containing protein